MVDQSNPSEKYGTLASQHVVTAVVVDIKDPNETGRIKCRILGEQDDQAKIPDDKLPWYQCITSNSPQVGGVGQWPNGNYAVGSKVMLMNMGQQGFFIMGSMPNNETEKGKQDRDMESTSKTKRQKIEAGKPKMPVSFKGGFLGDLNGSMTAMQMLNNRLPYGHSPDANPKMNIHMQSGIPSYLGSRMGLKVPFGKPPFSIGSFAHNMGDVTNPQSYIQGKLGSMGEMIPGALSIVDNLKKTAAQGLQIPAITSIGGMGNFTGAIMGILSLIKATGSKQKSEKNNLFYTIYYMETYLDALDVNGNETLEFKEWLILYLIRIGTTVVKELTDDEGIV